MSQTYTAFVADCNTKTIGELQEMRRALSEVDDADNYYGDGHRYLEPDEDDEYSEPFHYESACKMCILEGFIAKKQEIEESVKPGNNPHYYLPGKQFVTGKNIAAAELKPGMVSRFFYAPGSNFASYCVEVINVDCTDDGKVFVMWKKTNTDDTPFLVEYDAKQHCDVSEVTVITNTEDEDYFD